MDLAVWSAEDQKEGLNPHPPDELAPGSGEPVVVGSLALEGVPARDRVCSIDFLVVVGAGRTEPIVADCGVAGRATGVEVVGVWTREMGRFWSI